MRRSRDTTKNSDPKDSTDRVLQLATLTSIILSLPVVITQGKPTSAVLVLAIVLFCLGTRLLYLWRKRLPSSRDKYKGQRLFTTGLTLMVFLSLATVIAIPPSRSYFIYNMLGFRRSHSTLNAEGLSTAESPTYYRLILPIYNSDSEDQVVKQVSLDVDWQSREDCIRGGPPSLYFFKVADKLYIDKRTGAAQAGIMLRSGAAAGFNVTATGTWFDGSHCSDVPSSLVLDFSTPGLLLQGSTTTMIVIDIPMHIAITASNDLSAPHPSRQFASLPIPLPVNAYISSVLNYATYSLTVTTTTGAIISACIPARCSSLSRNP